MIKLIVFGLGSVSQNIIRYLDFYKVSVLAFSDNNENLWGTLHKVYYNSGEYLKKTIIAPKEIASLQCDYILIASSFYKEILEQLIMLGVEKSKIIHCYDLTNIFLRQVLHSNYFENPNDYIIEGFHIDLGHDHTLHKFQKKHPLYDRIFPYLAQLKMPEKKGGWIIDIGANVGDTMAFMVKHTDANILCIEPTDKFYKLLCKNINNLPDTYRKRVKKKKYYITDKVSEKYYSNIYGGTAKKVQLDNVGDKEEAVSISLIDLIKEEAISISDINLIKVDTDGYDAEALMSSGSLLANGSVFLYWENEFSDQYQYKKYLVLYEYLEKMGYTTYYVFDNFGNFLCSGDKALLTQLCEYLYRIIEKRSTRTFYYFDVLACKENMCEQCQELLNNYLGESDIR